MTLEIKMKDPGTGSYVEATARLYRTESGEFVDEKYSGPKRKHLYCSPGQRILREEARRHGLLGQAAEEPEGETGEAVKVDLKAVRAWAKKQDIDVPSRGKIPDEIVEQYRQAQADAKPEESTED